MELNSQYPAVFAWRLDEPVSVKVNPNHIINVQDPQEITSGFKYVEDQYGHKLFFRPAGESVNKDLEFIHQPPLLSNKFMKSSLLRNIQES